MTSYIKQFIENTMELSWPLRILVFLLTGVVIFGIGYGLGRVGGTFIF
ncbi:hypothetical protein [Salipaludibacillus aurantiacus]|uniref:Uncharacterized protein n=1 Tax=Salipaludibacillus aurantiacus TaxID=1601833 RepID=A0A1H9TY27_9BACI|nr:hypothetical protein [Salipaludibacillus aurantiacus]SES01921.1 hypothetical protein SAMN05518684_106156 [Salipaludibacillus aurantiacus]